jgi:predicted ArsR family transcriptional regulator
MQQTRQYILDILRERGEATVDEVVRYLQARRGRDITPVTVRHHINLLQQEALVTSPELRRRSSPGRPQHVYALTDKAREFFPNNYERLAAGLITRLEQVLPSEMVNVIFEGVADDMSREASLPLGGSQEERVEAAVRYLNEHGYVADWDCSPDGFVLRTRCCPYEHVSQQTTALCHMDMRLVSSLVGVVPRLISRMSAGDEACAYLIPLAQNNANGHR